MDSAILQFMMTYAQHVNSIFSQKKVWVEKTQHNFNYVDGINF